MAHAERNEGKTFQFSKQGDQIERILADGLIIYFGQI
jgi:hypothetical protein